MGMIVTAAVVVAKGSDGKQGYYYQGSTLPDELPKDEVRRLVDAGMVGDEDDLVARPGGEPDAASTEATRQEAPQREAKPARQNRNG